MKRLFLSILTMVACGVSFADTPPARSINSFTYDGTGTNAISSTLFGGVKALDMNVANPVSQPANVQSIVSGIAVDPRAIRVLTTGDAVTAHQGGTWNINNITGTISLPTGAATEVTLDELNDKVVTTVNGIKVDIGASTLSGTVFSKMQDGAGTNITSTLNSGKQSLDVNVTGSVLPIGASTEATLSALNTKFTTTANGVKVDGSAVTQPVSAATLPLPTGAATEATLSALNAKHNSLGQKTMAGSMPVVIASDQAGISFSNSNLDVLLSSRASEATLNSRATETTLSALNTKIKSFDLDSGAGTDNVQGVNLRFSASGGSVQAGTATAPIRVDPTGTTVQPVSGTVTANIGTVGGLALESTQSAINGKLNTLGQKNMAGSVPVVLASDQGAIPATQSGTWNINNISGTISLPTGAATSAKQDTINTTLGTSLPRRLQDGAGNNLTSQVSGSQRALDVGLNVAGVQIDPRQTRTLASGTDSVASVQSGTWNVGITGAIALPTGASTEAKQNTGNTTLATINGKILTYDGDIGAPAEMIPGVMLRLPASGGSVAAGTPANPLRFDPIGVTTQPVSVTSLPLPLGASTSAKQDSTIAAIGDVEDQLDVLLSTRASETTLGVLNSKFSTLGQKGMGNSVPVVIASDQTSIPVNVSGTVPLPTGAATSANQTNGSQITKISSGLSVVAVKEAATAPTVADPSLVVAISPNSPITVTSEPPVIGHKTGTITAACATGVSCSSNSYVSTATNGYTTLGFSVNGTWNASLTTDISYDSTCESTPSTASWFNQGAFDVEDSDVTYLTTWGTSRNGHPWVMNIAAVTCVRVRAVSFTSGTINVHMNTAVGTAAVWASAVGNIPSGSADKGNPIKIGGRYNAALPTLADGQRGDIQLDASGRLIIRPLTSGGDSVSAVQSGTWNVNNITGTVPLPTGAATAALQTTGNSTLSDISTNLDVLLSSRATEATLATRATEATLATRATEATLATRATEATLSALSAKFNTLGQKTMANSVPVVLSSDQSSLPVTQAGSWSTGRTWALSSGTDSVAATQSGTWNIGNITGTVPLPTGAATSALQTSGNASLTSINSSLDVVLSTRASEATLSTVNGKLNTLGQKTMANSMPVTLASDQSVLPVSQSGTWNINNIVGTVSLPTGAATAVNQTNGNNSLTSIDGKLTDGTQRAIARGAAKGATAAADVTSTNVDANTQALDVAVKVSALPAGAASASNQTAGNATLSSIDTKLTDGSQKAVARGGAKGTTTAADVTSTNVDTNTQALDVAVKQSALPTGAATAANQTTANASLSSIDTKVATAANQTTANASLSTITTNTGNAATNTSNINNKLGTLGQKAMAGSAPVVIASDQSTINMQSQNNGGAKTPGFLVTSASSSVASGAFSVSIMNTGNADGTVLGQTLSPGETVRFQAPTGSTLAAIAYVATGTVFKIAEVR